MLAGGRQVITSRVPHGYGEHGQYQFKPLREHIEHMRVDNHSLPLCARRRTPVGPHRRPAPAGAHPDLRTTPGNPNALPVAPKRMDCAV